jgi:predicted alpha/beta-hydrolase family hydrolase
MMARMSAPEERLTIDGPSPVSGVYGRPANAAATIVVAHGAGAGMDHPFLVGFTRAMNDEGIATLRFNFAYIEAGKRSPDRAPVAIETWRAAADTASRRAKPGEPIWASGKSFGGRVASMAVADGMPAAGLVFLGYPLHAPGKLDQLRDEHLYAIEQPMLFLHGTRDAFASQELLAAVVAKLGDRATLIEFDGADHSFNVRGTKRDAREVGASLAAPTAAFIREHA